MTELEAIELELINRELAKRQGTTPEQEIQQPQQQAQQQTMERQNILGQLFNVPGAAIRSAIQGRGYVQGAMQPSQMPTFQDLALDKYWRTVEEVTKGRSPREQMGIRAGAIMPGMGVSAVGLGADIATNPAVLLSMLVGKAPVGGGRTLGGQIAQTRPAQAVGRFVTKERHLKAPKPKDWAKFAQGIRAKFVGVKQAATDKFGSQIERLAIENPERTIDLSSIADDINDDIAGYTQEFKHIIKKIPGFKFEEGKLSLGETTLGKSQEMINYLKTKIPTNIKYQHLDLLDLESSLKATQLEAFPEMATVRQEYAKLIQPYNQIKAQFKFNRLLKAIEGDFGGAEGLNAVKQVLPKEAIKQMGKYKQAVKLGNISREILRGLIKWGIIATGAGAIAGTTKKLIE